VNPNTSKAESEYFVKAAALRDSLAKQVPSYKALFEAAK
jgi:hypothetical protein